MSAIPRHIAIVMDGNRRWARQRRLPAIAGHRAGVETIRKTLRAARERGVEYLTLYSFSTENWSRDPEEVTGLMGLLEETIRRAGPARSGPPDPRRRGAAGIELLALGGRLRRDVGDAGAVARLLHQ